MEKDAIAFKYTFNPGGVRERSFDLVLDARTLDLLDVPKGPYPGWTALDINKCPNCSLDSGSVSHCPVAVSLVALVSEYGNSLSYEESDVLIEDGERTYMKRTTLQVGLSSLAGILMVTSGCPVMAKLRPMVRFHLPFATEEETRYRAMSMYMLAQYMVHRKGGTPDWDMRGLVGIYEEVRAVNVSFCKRLSMIGVKDASVNAVVNLDCFAMSVAFSITRNMLDELESLFSPYLK